MFKLCLLFFLSYLLISCSQNNIKYSNSQYDSGSINQFGKTDFDRMADLEIRENIQSLRMLAIKLYKRNPDQLKKTTQDSADVMVKWIFNGDHKDNFSQLENKTDTDALDLVFNPEFSGDRVLALIIGLKSMLLKAHGNKIDFYIFDKLDPQKIYNVARNIEVVVWKLSSKKNEDGNPFLITNTIFNDVQNLSFEREFGKIIARTDFFAFTLSEKTERNITRAVQSVTTRIFLPFI